MSPPETPSITVFILLSKYFWAFIIVSQAALARREWKGIAERHMYDPDKIARYRSLFRGFLFWANAPWVLMGFLILTGKVQDVFAFLRPELMDAWILLWLASLILILLIGSFWLFFLRGAETLASHPGVPYAPQARAGQIKIIWALLFFFTLGAITFRISPHLPSPPDALHYLGFFSPLLFVGFWTLIVWITGKTGGWDKLAARYALEGKYGGRLFSASGQVGMANYGGILRMGADKQGFYLGVIFIFRVGHPPLYIPWEDVRAEEHKAFLMTRVRLIFTKAPDVTLRIPKSSALKLKELAGTKSALPEIHA